MELHDPITSLPFVGDKYTEKLKKLGIVTIADLLLHIPHRYSDYRNVSEIGNLKPNETATVTGQIVSMQNIMTKKGKLMQLATLSDGTRNVSIMWFNQPFLSRVLYPGVEVSVAGKVSFYNKKLVIFSPQYELLKQSTPVHTQGLIPVYPETLGISSKWLRARVNFVLKNLENIQDFLPENIREEVQLPSLLAAYTMIHKPENPEDGELGRKRLAFNELLEVQLVNNLNKIDWQKKVQSHKVVKDEKNLEKFVSELPFPLTPSQERSIKEITKDLVKKVPMNRLLEGDVGSGKTVVAAAAAFVCFLSGYQTIFMAPTQILAEQHFKTLTALLEKYKVRVSLITGAKSELNLGRADIIVGTTALVYNRVSFDKVALIVIDEQHRFGVAQRAKLAEKAREGKFPNVLTMTATPIPRSIALTMYGDLDLSTLDEVPKNRQKITTWIIPEKKRSGAYKWIEEQIQNEKSQVFVVCPLIDDSENEKMAGVKSVTAEYKKLKKIFPTLKIKLLHGKITADEKSKLLADFRAGKFDMLVATPVIEVGIDIPNATVMMIESAERFGLSQLHQLRGRVGRGSKKSYCLLLTSTKTKKATSRLEAIKTAKNGRELAELDLEHRGAGEIFGTRQHGAGELKIATWQDVDVIKKSRKLAIEIADNQKEYAGIMSYFKQKQLADN